MTPLTEQRQFVHTLWWFQWFQRFQLTKQLFAFTRGKDTNQHFRGTCCLHPRRWGRTFQRNVGNHLQDHATSYSDSKHSKLKSTVFWDVMPCSVVKVYPAFLRNITAPMIRGEAQVMNGLKEGWFSELSSLWPGMSLSLQVNEVLHSEKSDYQDILVLQTKSHGRALILDGIIQCTESDEFAYQEMISFLPLCSHPSPKKVLIVGGGDGGVAREVAKHPDVESIVQVEIDSHVLEVSKKFLPFMGAGLTNPKLTLHVGDGFRFMAQHRQEFDVIITDSSDPVGPAVCLFQQSYFESMREALKPGGIVCSQAGTVWANIDIVAQTFQHCHQTFRKTSFAYAAVPTYPTGQIGFVLGSLSPETNFKEPLRIFSETELDSFNMHYYSAEVHKAAFILPRFARKALDEIISNVTDEVNTGDR